MQEKLVQIALEQVEASRSKFFYAAGVAAYAMAVYMWSLVSPKHDLPTLLFFFKALTIISTGYWGCVPFAVITYRIGKKHGLQVGFAVWVAFGAVARLVHQQESDTVWWLVLRSITTLSVMGSVLGWAMALHTGPTNSE